MSDTPHRPIALRALAFGSRSLHRLSGGRIGSLEAGHTAPRGRFLQAITAVHRRLYALTGGLLGSDVGGLATLLLTTTGRKTGLQRTVPLPHFPHPEGFVVVASFSGSPKNPAWYENLVANPEVNVQVEARRFSAVARVVSGEERAALWRNIVARAPMYADYQRVTEREIPLVVLRPST